MAKVGGYGTRVPPPKSSGKVRIGADGSTSVTSNGLNNVVSNVGGGTSIVTGGVHVTVSPDGTVSVNVPPTSDAMLDTVLPILAVTALSLLVLRGKRRLGHVGYLLLTVLGLAGALVGGLTLGLILVAFLTTRSEASSEQLAAPLAAAGVSEQGVQVVEPAAIW